MPPMGLSHEAAEHFAKAWIEAWNSRDIEAILSHYADDVSFSSPFVVKVHGRENGILNSKEELRAYFLAALGLFPDLCFTDCVFYRYVRSGVDISQRLGFTSGGVHATERCLASRRRALPLS